MPPQQVSQVASRAPHPDTVSADDGVARVSHWPLQTRLCLGALDGAVPSARLHARNVLWEWGLKALADDAELVVSELMTNAVLAAQRHACHDRRTGPAALPTPVCLALSSDGTCVVIQVWDANPGIPATKNTDAYAAGGRGLLIIQALAATWNCYRLADPGGKVVWALLEPA
jgi:anti-sigma regulatory factor (Ser/Thr protein kinase)